MDLKFCNSKDSLKILAKLTKKYGNKRTFVKSYLDKRWTHRYAQKCIHSACCKLSQLQVFGHM